MGIGTPGVIAVTSSTTCPTAGTIAATTDGTTVAIDATVATGVTAAR